MSSLLDIYNKSREAYYNTGDYYCLTSEEIEILSNLGLRPATKEVTDDLFDTIQTLITTLQNTKINSIGAPISYKDSRKTKLPIPLPSIIECKEKELFPFISEYGKENRISYSSIIVMEKLDGCSCLLHYKDNKFYKAYTRGDGLVGQTITDLILNMEHRVPSFITSSLISLKEIFIRGELIIPKDEIDQALKEMEQEDGKPRKNARNAVAGQINKISPNKSFLKHVHFVAYQGLPSTSATTMPFGFHQSATLKSLEKNGFEVCRWRVCPENTREALEKYCDDKYMKAIVDNIKTKSLYECDGAVITLDSINYLTFSPNSKSDLYSRGVRKYKLNNLDYNKAKTKIIDIEWRISKGGLIKPRIRVLPITLGGVVINYVTGNNYNFIKENHLGINAEVVLKRAGDVIPQIVEVIKGSDDFKLPENAKIGEVDAYITDDEELKKEQDFKQFQFSATFFGIDQAGEKNLRKIYNAGFKTLDELIRISVSSLSNILGEAIGKKMWLSISNIFYEKHITQAQYCAANNLFGSRIGVRLLDKVYNEYKTLDVDEKSLRNIEGFSDITINKYMKYKQKALERIENVAKTAFIQWDNKIYNNTIINYKYSVVFTGVRDKNLEEKIKEQGGEIVETVNRADLIIAKEVNGKSSKLEKARAKNITIMSYKDALLKFGE